MEPGYLLQCAGCGAERRVPPSETSLPHRCGRCGAPLIGSQALPVEVTDATWEAEVAASEAPAVVVAWSPHCGVCGQYEVSVRRMAGSLFGAARVLTIDVEENRRTAERYGIKGVPMVLLFREGRLLAALPGPQGERGLRERLGV